MFAILKSIGCAIEIHPSLENGNQKRPDFLVTTPDGTSTYVEAVLASDYSSSEVKAQKLTDRVLDSIQKIDSPNFFIGVSANGHPSRPPKGRVLRAELQQWLTTLDPDVVGQQIEEYGHDVLPRWSWQQDGWGIQIEAIPKKLEHRGRGQRVIGALSGGTRWVNSWEPIRDAVKAKGSRYGELLHPLLIAINVDSLSSGRIDEMQGLYGQEECVVTVGDSVSPPRMSRRSNGAWHGKNGPQYKRVSGAWIFHNLDLWNLASRTSTVYYNPWATKDLPATFKLLPYASPDGEVMRWHDGSSVADVLKLPQGWPETC